MTIANRKAWSQQTLIRLSLFLLVLVGLWLIYRWMLNIGLVEKVLEPMAFREWVLSWGWGGPVVIILFMALAIVFKPIPSAAVALASGAAFGHTWGTLYIIVGAELGALLAFSISRVLGPEVFCRLLGRRIHFNWPGAQTHMMGLLFLSRLVPVIPFDIVSYAAGLTTLQTWRFIIATLVGLIPSSFLLAHFGGEMVVRSSGELLLDMLLVTVVLLPPVVLAIYFLRRQEGGLGIKAMVSGLSSLTQEHQDERTGEH